MLNADALRSRRTAVVTYANRAREPRHEAVIHRELARRLAVLQGLAFAGEYDPGSDYGGALYFVPSGTLLNSAQTRAMGLRGEDDLFGGAVPHGFVETKAITHPLLRPDAPAPQGWSRDFGRRVAGSVLAGYSVFSLADAEEAGNRLLHQGALRLKPVRASGGRGQVLIEDMTALARALQQLDPAELAAYGLVLETQLDGVQTFSVGLVRVGGQVISYFGTQRLTEDNAGESVYGGSELIVVTGDFGSLRALDLPQEAHLAVAQAQAYDAAATECFPGFFASRRNYDIGQGLDSQGRACSGVLEQSWRIGGASSAEVAALEAFAGGAAGRVLRASSLEVYGREARVPSRATVLFRGEDADVGFITKCVMVEDYEGL